MKGAGKQKKSDVRELKQHLSKAFADKDAQVQKEVVKKVIAFMTLGIDVSRLFSDMVMACHTKDLVIKKMVYLYLCKYAIENPELTVLVINTLLKDCQDEDPMIRGLALRSLCSLRVESVVEYMISPLKHSLTDTSGYVRKTGVVGVLKLFHISPDLVREGEMIDTLYNMLRDRDPAVIANCLAVLDEIMRDEGGIAFNQAIVHHVLNRMKDYNEWGQCMVMDLVSRYDPASEDELFGIMNLLDPWLRVNNSAVVMATARCFLKYADRLPNIRIQVYTRLKTPLLGLCSSQSHEITYIVLNHLKLLAERCPPVFADSFKHFFCNYNEPSHVKYLKLTLLSLVASEESHAEIVAELSVYVTDVDAELSRLAIEAIGKIGSRLPGAVDRCIAQLLEFVDLHIDYVRAETVVVMKDLLRKYPHRVGEVLPSLHRCLKRVEDARGKSAVVWMIGEYGQFVEDAPYILESLIDDVAGEDSDEVRLELLTAATKLFFKRPPEMQKMLGRLFSSLLGEVGEVSPDLRDRALFYYRLLAKDVDSAAKIVAMERPPVKTFAEEGNADLRRRIFAEFNTLAPLYRKPAKEFVHEDYLALPVLSAEESAEPDASAMATSIDTSAAPHPPVEDADGDLLGMGPPAVVPLKKEAPPPVVDGGNLLDMGDDLLSLGSVEPPAAQFALDPSAVIRPNEFQSSWRAWTESFSHGMAVSRDANMGSIEAAFKRFGVSCVASGDTGTVLKFYAGGKALAPSSGTFLLEIQVEKASCMLSAVIKSDNPPAVPGEFLPFFSRVVQGL